MRALRGRLLGAILAGAALAVACLTFAGSGGAASRQAQLDNQLLPCGTFAGPRWTVPGGHSGTDWAVFGINENGDCGRAGEWLDKIGREVLRGRLDLPSVVRIHMVGAVHANPTDGLNYACVAVHSILVGICLEGDGGVGAFGVLVIGNAAENPYTAVFTHTGEHFSGTIPTTPPRNFVFPAAAIRSSNPCDPLDHHPWEIRSRFADHAVAERGSSWKVLGDGLTCLTGAPAQLVTRLADDAFKFDNRSFDSEAYRFTADDGWACIVARTIQSSGSHQFVTGVPISGCTRYLQPFGDTVPGFFEQFLVVPDAHAAASLWPLVASYGITTAAVFQIQLDGGSVLRQPTWHCGREFALSGLRWNHVGATRGSESREKWLLATSGGYPCNVATAIFKQYLAHQALLGEGTGTLTADGEPDGGWTCDHSPSAVDAVCTFNLFRDRSLRNLFGIPSTLKPLRVGIIGSYPGAQAVLDRALTAP